MTAAVLPTVPEDGSDPLVMSVAEAARMLGISRTLAYGLVARGELPSFRMGGRIRHQSLGAHRGGRCGARRSAERS